jgi:hypothetical protein
MVFTELLWGFRIDLWEILKACCFEWWDWWTIFWPPRRLETRNLERRSLKLHFQQQSNYRHVIYTGFSTWSVANIYIFRITSSHIPGNLCISSSKLFATNIFHIQATPSSWHRPWESYPFQTSTQQSMFLACLPQHSEGIDFYGNRSRPDINRCWIESRALFWFSDTAPGRIHQKNWTNLLYENFRPQRRIQTDREGCDPAERAGYQEMTCNV